MAFFEQLGKRLTDAGQGVAQQTKNFTDVTRLNGTISEKEKKISQLYAAIGQAYFERHRNDAAAEEAQKIGEINALLAEIAQCREEIKQIKGVVKCPSCGADVALHCAFCSACGARFPQDEAAGQPAAADARLCPSCGAAVPKENLFCNRCGTKLDAAE